jgi:hypothetical protein
MYVSNVEMYLFRNGVFGRYAENVRALPVSPNGVIIRSYFGRGPMIRMGGPEDAWPQPIPGHLSAQVMQPFAVFLPVAARGDSASYHDLFAAGSVDLSAPKRFKP